MKTRCLALFSESALILALSFAAITAVQVQVGKGLIDPNVAAEKDLLALPSMTPAIVNFVLDVFFGDAFLTFPNKAATLGFTLPAFSSELGRFFLYISDRRVPLLHPGLHGHSLRIHLVRRVLAARVQRARLRASG